MNNFSVTDDSGYHVYNMALSDNQGPEQQMALMSDGENNSRHSTAGNKGDSALTAFLRSKQQRSLSGTQYTNSTFDTFAQDQEWVDDDDVLDDESILSIDIKGIENDLFSLSRYKAPDDESITSIDIVNDIHKDLIPQSIYSQEAQEWGDDADVPIDESVVPIDINGSNKNYLTPSLSSYSEGAVDKALMWTEAFMDHHDDSDEESIDDAPLLDSTSFFTEGVEKLTDCMSRSALTRQELARQYSEKSLGSTTSTTTDISQRSFNHNDSLQLQNSLGLGSSSSHSSTSTSGLGRPRIKKAQSRSRSGLIRRHSYRSISAHDSTKRGLVQKDPLVNLDGSVNSLSLHGNSSRRNLYRSSSCRDTSRSLVEEESSQANLSLRVKARLAQNVFKRRMLDQHFVVGAPKLKLKPTNNDMVQHLSEPSMSSIVTFFREKTVG
jgi:hypothetical protein